MFIDFYYIVLILPALAFAMYAQFRVNYVFSRYKGVANSRGLTGAEVARQILDRNGLQNVPVENIHGNLNDHYDPRTRTIRLSDATYASRSIAAIGVAAHEAGHALQHSTEYVPLMFRNSFFPVANFGSGLGPILAFIGLFMGLPLLVEIGIVLFTLAVGFTVITLPVEFNATNRALNTLETTGLLTAEEMIPTRKVLGAAALTYVAAAAVAIAQLLRLVLLSRRDD